MKRIIKIIDEEKDKADILSCMERAYEAIDRNKLREAFGLYITAENLYRVMERPTDIEITLGLSGLLNKIWYIENAGNN